MHVFKTAPVESLPAQNSTLQQLQSMIERVTLAGGLSRQDEEVILSMVAMKDGQTPQKCGLFRQLQTRVWWAELYLED